jgi:hypothetical protein
MCGLFLMVPPTPLQDFLERLPLTCMTDPRLGASPLNLASTLQPSDNPTDLGPKCYIAYGRRQESAKGVWLVVVVGGGGGHICAP